MRSFMPFICATVIMVLSIATVATAAAPSAPEIEPSSVTAGLGVLAAGVLMMKSRRGSRK
jgi:hypothetical protein